MEERLRIDFNLGGEGKAGVCWSGKEGMTRCENRQ